MSLLTQLVSRRGRVQLCLPQRPGVTYGPDLWESDQSPRRFCALPETVFILLLMYSRISGLSLGASWELVILPHRAEEMFAEGRDGGQIHGEAVHFRVTHIPVVVILFRH